MASELVGFDRHFSAGGVVYQVDDDGIEIVLCGRDAPATWSLPKGTPERGESVEGTALREVREETGLVVGTDELLGDIHYWFEKLNTRVRKTVTFYLMLRVGGSTSDHDSEFDRVQWFAADLVADVMTYPSEVEIVRRAITRIEQRAKDAVAKSRS